MATTQNLQDAQKLILEVIQKLDEVLEKTEGLVHPKYPELSDELNLAWFKGKYCKQLITEILNDLKS